MESKYDDLATKLFQPAAKTSEVILSSDTQNEEPCYLLKCPREIRDMIYKLLLVRQEGINTKLLMKRLKPGEEQVLAIALTCKQLKYETLPIYYGFNNFLFWDMDTLHRFLPSLSIERRDLIQKVTFRWHNTELVRAFKYLRKCEGLRDLGIIVNHYTAWPKCEKVKRNPDGSRPYRGDLLKTRGMDDLRKIRGCEIVSISAQYDRSPFQDQHLEQVEKLLKKELCRPKKTWQKKATNTPWNLRSKGRLEG